MLKLMERADTLTNGNTRYKVNGYRIQITYKLYIVDIKAKKRIYLAPHISYASAKIAFKSQANQDEYLKGHYLNYALLLGFQCPLITERLDWDMFIGFGYKDNRWEEKYNGQVTPYAYEESMYMWNGNLKMYLGFNIGFVFR